MLRLCETVLFLSTPSARRATHRSYAQVPTEDISIHALREEGDLQTIDRAIGTYGISIHALREEGDLPAEAAVEQVEAFLSTPSARRATVLLGILWR